MIGPFAALLDRLVITRSRNEKVDLIRDFLRTAATADRGWVLAALAGSLDLPQVTASTVRKLAATRVDETLIRLSREFVGDTAETVALIWPESGLGTTEKGPALSEIVTILRDTPKAQMPGALASLLDRSSAGERFAILKLALGNFGIGISERLAKTAFAEAFSVPLAEVEEYWHSSPAPHDDLFAWAADGAAPPDVSVQVRFRPFMLAAPLDDRLLDLAAFAAEWKWDGIRVQLARQQNQTRLFSRGGEDITNAFPEFDNTLPEGTAVDGELLIDDPAAPFRAASFATLQKRLGRKSPSAALLSGAPAFIRIYDLLEYAGADLRTFAWSRRRTELEGLVSHLDPSRFDLSPLVGTTSMEALNVLRLSPPAPSIEGLMLKRRDSPYTPGRMIGAWFKWKRDPYTADCVLMYAQRGSGKRASFYSDFTFGCWTPDNQLVPVGKAYFGFTDEELTRLDRFVRGNTINRYGPVIEVEKTLVFEIAFDSVAFSSRHKSGVAMRFPRVHRIRWEKPAAEADRVDSLVSLAGGQMT